MPRYNCPAERDYDDSWDAGLNDDRSYGIREPADEEMDKDKLEERDEPNGTE